MKAGVTYGEMIQAAKKVNRRPNASGALTVHGRGLGDDGPLITNQSNPDVAGTAIPANTVFVIKPGITYNGKSDVGHVGDTVVVTANGCERLGTRPIEHYWHVD
jgi:Xaa-Pro aminopeptidase